MLFMNKESLNKKKPTNYKMRRKTEKNCSLDTFGQGGKGKDVARGADGRKNG